MFVSDDDDFAHLRDPQRFLPAAAFCYTTSLTPEHFEQLADEEAEERLWLGIYEEQVSRLVTAALKQLPALKRRVVELVFWHDLSQKEVALVCGVSPARVCQILNKAYVVLRPILAPLVQ